MPLERLFDNMQNPPTPDDLYRELHLPGAADRPYVYVNMVATVDGKSLLGPRGSTAKGLGSPTDQMLMRRLEEAADGVIVGASTLRTSHVIYPPKTFRAVVTRSGELPLENRFFTDAPDRAIVFAPSTLPEVRKREIQKTARVLVAGADSVDVKDAVNLLHNQFGVMRLLLEGGPQLNFDFLSAGLIDEFFLTVAPKLKGGSDLPTPIDGPGLPGFDFAPMELKSAYRDGSELFLRYRTVRDGG